MDIQKIKIKDVKKLLDSGKIVRVKTLNGDFTKIKNYITKGILDTYEIELENLNKIKVSATHLFFSNIGWIKTENLKVNKHSLLCDDGGYHLVKKIEYVGKHNIVDIGVEHLEQCYFGNGILNHNSGKSLLIGHILAETQKKDGIAVLIDTEDAIDRDFLKIIGVDLNKLIYVNTNLIEDVFEIIESIIEKVRKDDSNKLITIAVDSIMGATDKTEDEAGWDKAGYKTQKAIIIGQAMRKITHTIAKYRIALVFTNQLRTKLGVLWGDPLTTSGGKAIGFHASLRLRLKMLSQIKLKDKTVGIKVNCTVKKSRFGSMYNSCNFDIYFDRGLDPISTWFEEGKRYKIIIPAKKLDDVGKKMKEVKGWNMLDTDENQPEHFFQLPSFEEKILKNSEKKEYLYTKLVDNILLKYKNRSQLIPMDKEELKYIGDEEDEG